MKTLRVVLWSIADDLEVRQSASQNNSSVGEAVAEYCDERVCVTVCERISGTTRPIFTKFCCEILFTSRFMNGVIFADNGPYGGMSIQ